MISATFGKDLNEFILHAIVKQTSTSPSKLINVY